MKHTNQKWERLASYFAKNCTEDEREEVSQWLRQATPEDRRLYETAEELWKTTHLKESGYSPDVNKGWERLQLKTGFRQKTNKAFPYTRIAAALLLLMVFTFLFLRSYDDPDIITVAAQAEIEQVALPDGSLVWLNRDAVLTYSTNFNDDHREVSLKGEAFFEVEKADGKRFTIFTETTKTEVLGTSFNMEATPGKSVKVQVATGKVAFSALDGEDAVLLEPGEEAVFISEKKSPIIKTVIENPNYRAWQNKQLSFNNTSLKVLSETLEEYFNTTIVVPEGLRNCRFTVSFRDPEIQEILNVLALTGNLEIIKDSKGYAFSGQGCNE